jgi:AraC-like DNA-binding protein
MYGKAVPHPMVQKFLVFLEVESELYNLGLDAIAMKLGVSVSHLQHLVRRDIGTTCTRLIRAKCVQQMAIYLREHPEKTISEIAYQWGFDPKTMRRHFAVELGSSPSAIRKKQSRN